MSVKVTCHKCGKITESISSIGLRDECTCGADLHACMSCKHYDASSYNECREPVAERVREKDRANFCDFFLANSNAAAGANKSVQDLRSAAEALFKKK